ncbi:hypothetical protein C8A01DRAFT_12262 [Parachaetomium inaequale]|uniref:Uncharacterized protein n=1 Tax=Parachaetomium inaequale TaxID=2588326 RepID=A0AAN6PNM3_9PEZI|nr:hypothetical protein C8A01DRAFT_12262 [Parachaetomium inaequale]
MAEQPTSSVPSALAEGSPAMDAERGGCVPRVQTVGHLGVKYNWTQVVGRFFSVLLELGALAFIAWLYSYWRSETTTRVDVLFPSFFPVIVGILADSYEVVSLLFFNRRRAINPVAICFDIALIGSGIFCFLVLGMVDPGSGERRGHWAADMTSAMIFMIVFCIVHAGFIVLAAAGMIHIYFSINKARRDARLAKSQAEMVQFNERREQMRNQPRIA